MPQEKDGKKIETCEGKASLIERIAFTYEYRTKRYKIVLLARDLLEDEEALLDSFQDQLMEQASGEKTKLAYEAKLAAMSTHDWVKYSAYQTALRLGTNEKILNEGWQGVTDVLFRPRKDFEPTGKPVEVSYESIMRLLPELRTKIINTVSARFRGKFDEGEAKN